MTKKEAIILSYRLWKWMQESKIYDKEQWPKWGKLGRMNYDCPCCEYMNYRGDQSAIERCAIACPLINIWPVENKNERVPCNRKGSPFEGYEIYRYCDCGEPECKADNKELAKIVDKMVAAIEGEMKRQGIRYD